MSSTLKYEPFIDVYNNPDFYRQQLLDLIEEYGKVDINWFVHENCLRYDSIHEFQDIILPNCNVLDFLFVPNTISCSYLTSDMEAYYNDFISYGAKHNTIDLNNVNFEEREAWNMNSLIKSLMKNNISLLPFFKNEEFAFGIFNYFEADYKPIVEQYYSYIRNNYLKILKEHPQIFARHLKLFPKVDHILTEYQKAYNSEDFSVFNEFEKLVIDEKLPKSDEELLSLIKEQSNFEASPIMFALTFGDYNTAYRLFKNDILEKEEIQDILQILLDKVWQRNNIEFTRDVLLFIKKHNIALDDDVKEEILNSKDPYITDDLPEIKYFFKEAIGDLNYFEHNDFLPEEKLGQINIALSNGNSQWSNGLLSAFKYFASKYENFNIYMINQDIIDRFEGEELDRFYRQFDGWANPGSGDTYHTSSNPIISLESWQPENSVDKVYASSIKASNDYNFPYLGVCLGTQHLTLHSGGEVQREGLSGSQTIHFLEGTLGYFNAFNLEEKLEMLKTCVMPELIIKGDCEHSYSAVPSSLENAGLTQAAYSENKNLAMMYVNKDKMGVQFHPEHKHLSCEYSFNILDSFNQQAQLHNLCRTQGAEFNSEDFMEFIEERLEQCLHAPTTMLEEDPRFELFEEFYRNATLLEYEA